MEQDTLEPMRSLRYPRPQVVQEHQNSLVAEESKNEISTKQQEVEAIKVAYTNAKDTQSPTMRTFQEKLLADVSKKVTAQCYDKHFSDLVVTDDGASGIVVIAPNHERARYLRAFYTYLLRECAGVSITIKPDKEVI